MSIIRAAMTQTINAYPDMPGSIDALSQLAGDLDAIRQSNVNHNIELAGIAADSGADVICFGELFTAPYFALSRDPMWIALAEDARTGPTISAVSEAAARLGIVIIAPIYELDPSTGNRFNTAVVIDADGAFLGKYRKAHIPVGTNEQARFDERFYYGPSELPQNESSPNILGENPSFPVFRTAAGDLGVAICYDRHFEGVVASLSRAGAKIIFCPAVTFGAKSERIWEIEFDVDASRHRVFIGGSNRLGSESPWNQPFFGRTLFTGPSGRIADISKDNRVVIADIDLGSLSAEDESGWDLDRDARPGIYG